jgi:hypothetical protein
LGNIKGKIACALAGIILAEIAEGLRVVVPDKQTTEQRLAYFVPLPLQAIGITAEEQTEHLQQQDAKSKRWQDFSQFDKYHGPNR